MYKIEQPSRQYYRACELLPDPRTSGAAASSPPEAYWAILAAYQDQQARLASGELVLVEDIDWEQEGRDAAQEALANARAAGDQDPLEPLTLATGAESWDSNLINGIGLAEAYAHLGLAEDEDPDQVARVLGAYNRACTKGWNEAVAALAGPRYRIQATYTPTQGVTSDATGPETLGRYYGVLFESREEAEQAIAELEGDAESYGLEAIFLVVAEVKP